jgi:Tfp pilus assembly protein PilF
MLQVNQYENALKDFQAALRIDPSFPGIYTLVGTAQDKLGDVDQAEQSFREALKVNAEDFEANVYLGTILLKKRELGESKPYLERALQLNPSSALAQYEMAIWESTSGQYQAATDRLEALVKDNPKWLEPHVELASLYYRLHRPEDGLRERKIVERLSAERQAAGPAKQP